MSKQTRSDREAVKAKAAAERARREALDKRRRLAFVVVGLVAAVGILGAVIVGINQASKNEESATGPTPAIVASNGGGDDGGIPNGPTIAEADAKGIPTIDVWEDFQCPICKTFEQESGPTLQKLAAAKKARVVYHPVNIIGPKLTGDIPRSSSLRAASAFACATTGSIAQGMKWHEIAFANQPEEGVGITDEQIVNWASQAGVWGSTPGTPSDAFLKCVEEQSYVGWVERVTNDMSAKGVTGTPTVFVAGKELTRSPNQYTPAGITAAVAAATKAK